MSKLKSKEMDKLFKGILSLKNEEECYAFFEDICTVSELLAMKQRFEVAGLLRGGMLYNEIVSKIGASTATISRVNKCLEYGNDGYKTVFERIEDESV